MYAEKVCKNCPAKWNVYETQVYKTHHYLIKGAGKMGLVVVLAPGITRMLEKLISLYVLLAL